LNLSPRLLRDLIDAGEIPARTNSTVTRISRADIEVFRRRTESGVVGVEAEIRALFPNRLNDELLNSDPDPADRQAPRSTPRSPGRKHQ
jgi:hypothetical protein